eukprot:scaffold41455_cov32-Attheya_sp.AAC.1
MSFLKNKRQSSHRSILFMQELAENLDITQGDETRSIIRARYNPEMKCPAQFSALQVEVSALES